MSFVCWYDGGGQKVCEVKEQDIYHISNECLAPEIGTSERLFEALVALGMGNNNCAQVATLGLKIYLLTGCSRTELSGLLLSPNRVRRQAWNPAA